MLELDTSSWQFLAVAFAAGGAWWRIQTLRKELDVLDTTVREVCKDDIEQRVALARVETRLEASTNQLNAFAEGIARASQRRHSGP